MTLEELYDPEHFRQAAHRIVDLLADYLAALRLDPSAQKVLDFNDPDTCYEEALRLWNDPSPASLDEALAVFLRKITRMHHPHYLGHQTSVVAPPAALAELVGALLDPGMGVFEQGTLGVALERIIAEKLAGLAGWGAQAGGFLTSGGTLGNLTALLCARQVMTDGVAWSYGTSSQPLAFMASAQAHYSVDRAVRTMGLGAQGLISVPTNDRYQLEADKLEPLYQQATERGIRIIGVVASSCSTATGSFDPLPAIADFCEKHKLWLHVDGAHGACVLFSKKHRHLLEGIERADSFILDFHKMLMTPKLATAVVFRNNDSGFRTFSQQASYLWQADEAPEWYNLGKRTFELTKSFMSIRIYALWRVFGERIFEENTDRLFELASHFNELLQRAPDFDTAIRHPQANILCFRHCPPGLDHSRLDHLQVALREKLVREGKWFVVGTRLAGRQWLRTTLMNPFTAVVDLVALLDDIRRAAADIIASAGGTDAKADRGSGRESR